MNWEAATFGLTALVLVLQIWNAYTVASLKYWTAKNFVAKEDMSQYISPLKESIQMVYSEGRLRDG